MVWHISSNYFYNLFVKSKTRFTTLNLVIVQVKHDISAKIHRIEKDKPMPRKYQIILLEVHKTMQGPLGARSQCPGHHQYLGADC